MLKSRHKRQFKIEASVYAGSDERCGDSYQWTVLPDGKLAVAVSDGMGKGNLAARESGRAVNSVIALLKAGMDPEMALQVLNLLWTINNRKELFPTMDLALLDPESRELKIYKIGAAPTLVVRSPHCRTDLPDRGTPERIEILTAPAMPMGVSEYSEIPCISTLVMPGDRITMMTDGVADSMKGSFENSHGESGNLMFDEMGPDWLCRLLKRIKSHNFQTVCDLIIREAALNYGNREKDDMAVVIFSLGTR